MKSSSTFSLSDCASGIAHRLLWQIPIVVFIAIFLIFHLGKPLCHLDSDSATFALMGEDIYHYGNFPVLTYGQNYLFSITPYVYAALKSLLPDNVSWAMLLAMAGGLLSMSGLWMIYASFLAAGEITQRRSWTGAILFGILMLSMPRHFFDFGLVSSVELAYFVLGIILLSASNISKSMQDQHANPAGWWLLFGLAFGYGIFSRIQVCTYGVIMLVLLLQQQFRLKARPLFLVAVSMFGAGLFAGCLPMLWHKLFRADAWPFAMELGATWTTAAGFRNLLNMFLHLVLPTLFSVDGEADVTIWRQWLLGVWVIAVIAGYVFHWSRRRISLTAMDHGMFWGPVIIVAIMLTHTNMITDQSNRRYCLQMMESLIWLFCRLCVPVNVPADRTASIFHRIKSVMVILLCLLLAATSTVYWKHEAGRRREMQRNYKKAQQFFIPEIARHDGVIIANYWDAYVLAVLAQNSLKIEAQPWFWVRTYGRYSAEELKKNSLWLIRSGDGRTTDYMLRAELGNDIVDRRTIIPVENKFCGRDCELWSLPNPYTAVALYKQYHPRYLGTRYPPGSVP